MPERDSKIRWGAVLPAALLQAAANYPKGALDDLVERGVLRAGHRKLWHAPRSVPELLQARANDPGMRDIPTSKAHRTFYKKMQPVVPLSAGQQILASKRRTILLGKGYGRAVGGLAGVATLPVFLKGVRDLQHADTGEEKAKALGTVALASGLQQGGKTTLERLLTRRPVGGRSRLLPGLALGSLGVGQSLLTASAITKSRKEGKSTRESLGRAAGVGAAAGAGKGILEELAARAKKTRWNSNLLKRVAAAGSGRAASSALGAVILDRVVASTLKKD